MRPEGIRAEILRLEEERLRLAPEVMGDDPAAVEEDKRLERRIVELAGTGREARSAQLMVGWRRNHPGEGEGEKGGSGGGRP